MRAPGYTRTAMEFVEISVDEGPAAPDGLTMRWRAIEPSRVVLRVPWESDEGLTGLWSCHAVDDAAGLVRSPARAVRVEDSADGVAWLVVGGRHGLALELGPHGARVPYLLLGRGVPLELSP